MRPIKAILVPTDFSGDSAQALELAGLLTQNRGARLVLLHVVPAADPAVVVRADRPSERVRAEHAEEDLAGYRREAEERLAALRAPYPGMVPERVVREGAVVPAILRAAEEFGADLVVMGTRGQNDGDGRVMGRVAEEVTKRAGCPVVAIRDPGS